MKNDLVEKIGVAQRLADFLAACLCWFFGGIMVILALKIIGDNYADNCMNVSRIGDTSGIMYCMGFSLLLAGLLLIPYTRNLYCRIAKKSRFLATECRGYIILFFFLAIFFAFMLPR